MGSAIGLKKPNVTGSIKVDYMTPFARFVQLQNQAVQGNMADRFKPELDLLQKALQRMRQAAAHLDFYEKVKHARFEGQTYGAQFVVYSGQGQTGDGSRLKYPVLLIICNWRFQQSLCRTGRVVTGTPAGFCTFSPRD